MLRAAAPGKLLLTGAYAVLTGATAVVIAVDRYAIAHAARRAPASREVRAALGQEEGPWVAVGGLYEGGAKLGLGSSAAVLVASLGLRAAAAGHDLQSDSARLDILRAARRAHAEAQGGGSGVDVAASVFGGVLAYSMGSDAPSVRPLPKLPPLFIDAVWSGVPARTSELRARVDELEQRNRSAHSARLRELGDASARAARSIETNDAKSLLDALRYTQIALEALGRDAAAPIVPHAFSEAARHAEREHAVFYPSGAGGGDVAILAGHAPPSSGLLARFAKLGMRPLSLSCDWNGVRLWKPAPNPARS